MESAELWMTAHQTQTRSSSFGIERRALCAGHEAYVQRLRRTREVVSVCVSVRVCERVCERVGVRTCTCAHLGACV